MSGAHQLSFEGTAFGRGDISPVTDSSIIFQSEREPGNPFYQIYTLDLKNGMSQLVSPGTGKVNLRILSPGRSAGSFFINLP